MADSAPPIIKRQPNPPKLRDANIGSKGLRKKVVRNGSNWQTPFPGDEVEVICSGKIKEGPFLDNAGEKGTHYKFKLGQCEVIKGLDEGICTMKKGEKATFTIPPILAYADHGFPPLIPPGSTLIFDVHLVSWTSIRDLTGDGGVMKRILQEGGGWATPRDSDEVSVRHEVILDNGAVVSKSQQDCIEFYVGDGTLCPAIHKAVKSMRKGEKAELRVRFSYGIGLYESGSFNIHLELISWKTVVDVTGDKTILKKIVEAGQGFDHPSEGSIVKVRYVGKNEDGSLFDEKGSDEEPFEYTCLQEQVSEELDRAIMSMKRGEKAQVTVNSSAIYEIELVNFTKEIPFWEMETDEKLEMCKKKKEEGNVLFKAGKFWQASKKYEKAVKCIEFNHSFTDSEKRAESALKVSCYLNNAACKLKMEEYDQVSKLCSKVLEDDPSNVKALFRRAQAYLKTSELEKAESDIKMALENDPSNRDVKKEYKVLKEHKREHALHQANFFTTIFAKLS